MPACPDQPASVRQGSAPALHGSVYYHTEPMDETAFPDGLPCSTAGPATNSLYIHIVWYVHYYMYGASSEVT